MVEWSFNKNNFYFFITILLSVCFIVCGDELSKTEQNILSVISQKLDEAAIRENYSGALLIARKKTSGESYTLFFCGDLNAFEEISGFDISVHVRYFA